MISGLCVVHICTTLRAIFLLFSLIDRVQRTVRGSADDIGWLKRAPEMPPVVHGTERFMEILDEIRYN